MTIAMTAIATMAITPSGADAPAPVLDTGGHMAKIEAIVFSADGNRLVSASHDKTIRLWDVEAGRSLALIRGEATRGDVGKLYAMAMSPDGKWLAAGGWTHPECAGRCGEIRLYNFATGRLAGMLKGHENVVLSLGFSPDSRRLVSGGFDKTAIIWDVASRKALWRLEGHGAEIYGAAFTPDGARVVTSSYDRSLKLWSTATGALLQTMGGHKEKVQSLAVAPDGRIASGDWSGEIRLWDGASGAFIRTVARQQAVVGALAFAPGGRALLAACGGGSVPCGADNPQRVYDIASGAVIASYPGHDNSVFAAAMSPDGRWAATGGGNNNEIHIWNPETGALRLKPDGRPLILGGTGRSVFAVGFSATGRRIAWGNVDPCPMLQGCPNQPGLLQHAMPLPGPGESLSTPAPLGPDSAKGFLRPLARHDDWSLEHRRGGDYDGDAILEIKQRGSLKAAIERASTDGFRHNGYSFSPGGETIVSSGAGGWLSAYGLDGGKLGEFVGHEGDVWALAPSYDGRYLVSGGADQTLRLWNFRSRELIVTLFHGADGEWVMWTPQGYYASSPHGDAIIGWQINHGWDEAPDYYAAAQFKKHFYRPDIVSRAIDWASAERAAAASGARFDLDQLLRRSPPKFAITRPEDKSTLVQASASVTIAMEPNADPVRSYEVMVNGRQVAFTGVRGLARSEQGVFERSFEVPLEPGENHIRVTVANDVGQTERELRLHYAGPPPSDTRGALYVVAIGVDAYAHVTPLRFAGADAREFRDALVAAAGPLYATVKSLVLASGAGRDPTKANIDEALTFFRAARPEDTVMLFMAGHGVNDGADYLFLPQDAALDGERWRLDSTVKWSALQAALQSARGRRLMFVDTCHSGGAFNPRLIKDAADAQIIVFSAADANTLAQERPNLGHGVFTYALIEGLKGGADIWRRGSVSLFGLQAYVSEKVTQITGAAQAPVIHLSGAKDFVLASR